MNCREWTYLLLTLLLLTTSTIGFAMFAAFFPPAMVGLGLHQTYIAPIFSSFTVGNVICSIASAPLATRFGRRPILRLGVAAVSAGSLLFGLVPDFLSTELPMVLLFSLARCVQGGGGGIVSAVAMSTLSDQFPKNKGKVLGMASSSGAMAFFVGPPVGGVLFELGGFRLPFVLAAVLPPICCAHLLTATHRRCASATASGTAVQCVRKKTPRKTRITHIALHSCSDFVGGFFVPIRTPRRTSSSGNDAYSGQATDNSVADKASPSLAEHIRRLREISTAGNGSST